MINRILFLSCALLTGVLTQPCAAQSSLTLDQAVIKVLENHPKLKIADYEAQAMAARMRHALQLPADKATLSLENFAGTGETVAIRGIEATLSLSRTLELGNKARSRADVIRGESQLLTTQNDIYRLELLAETTRRFLHVAADQERLNLAEEAIELVQLTEKTVQDRIKAGRTPEVEQQRVAIDLAHQDLELEHIRHELEYSRVSLATLWGARQPDYERVNADVFQLNELPAFESLTDLLDRNPEIILHIKAEDLARAKIRLMESKLRPDVDVTAGLRYLGSSNDVAAMVWASIPLGSYSRAQPGIDEAEAMSRIEPLNLEQQRLELHEALFEMYLEMKHAREAIGILNERILPAAEKMLTDYRTGYQSGRYSLLELVQVQELLRNSRLQLVEMAYSYHSRKIEIDRLTGAQLIQW